MKLIYSVLVFWSKIGFGCIYDKFGKRKGFKLKKHSDRTKCTHRFKFCHCAQWVPYRRKWQNINRCMFMSEYYRLSVSKILRNAFKPNFWLKMLKNCCPFLSDIKIWTNLHIISLLPITFLLPATSNDATIVPHFDSSTVESLWM